MYTPPPPPLPTQHSLCAPLSAPKLPHTCMPWTLPLPPSNMHPMYPLQSVRTSFGSKVASHVHALDTAAAARAAEAASTRQQQQQAGKGAGAEAMMAAAASAADTSSSSLAVQASKYAAFLALAGAVCNSLGSGIYSGLPWEGLGGCVPHRTSPHFPPLTPHTLQVWTRTAPTWRLLAAPSASSPLPVVSTPSLTPRYAHCSCTSVYRLCVLPASRNRHAWVRTDPHGACICTAMHRPFSPALHPPPPRPRTCPGAHRSVLPPCTASLGLHLSAISVTSALLAGCCWSCSCRCGRDSATRVSAALPAVPAGTSP